MENAFDRPTFIAEITSKLDSIRDQYLSDNDTDDKVFCYAIAEMFESGSMDPDDDVFTYTDGPNDQGIDFAIHRENEFKIYQCKSTDLENQPNGKTYDASPVNELAEAIDFMIGNHERKGNDAVTELRNRYQLNQDENTLTAILAIEGKLSAKAQERFEEIKNGYSEKDVIVKLIDESTLYESWHALDPSFDPSEITLKLSIDDERAALWQKDWFCAVLQIEPLLKGIEHYGSSLFDMNVRSALKGSEVNKSITETIRTRQGQKDFVHLNNGLVITCNNYQRSSDSRQITLKGAQVINGCQTLNSIWDYYYSANPEDKNQLCKNLRVLAKVIAKNDNELLDKITVASNKQNPMNERNLKSNSLEQRAIQTSFYRDPLPKQFRYYYIRKDGEFETFLKTNVRIPKKRDFAIEGPTKSGIKNQYRNIDNERLAKIWWAWIGNGSQANAGSLKYFSKGLYSNIFLKKPSDDFWSAAINPDSTFNSSLLIDGQVSPYQFLLAMATGSFIEAKVKPEGGTARFKKTRIEELKAKKLLSDSPSQQDIAQALAKDDDYLFISWASQMTFAMTEVAAFLLNYHYGPLNSEISMKLINLSDVAFWLQCGSNEKLINSTEMTEGNFLLHKLFDFMQQALKTFFMERKSIILLENRPKLYLSKQENIVALKKQCIAVNSEWRDFPHGTKAPGMTFFESFPSI